jgi:hypothetical protein
MQIDLTEDQVRQIEAVLFDALKNAGPDDVERLRGLLHALTSARETATERVQCPECGEYFNRLQGGRPSIYCSHKCKQRAYRQRVRDRRKQFGPRKD